MKLSSKILGGRTSLIILGAIVLFCIYLQYNNYSLKKEYPKLDDSQSLNGIVTNKKIDILRSKSKLYLELEDGTKFSFPGQLVNYEYEERFFQSFIRMGDKLVRHAYSDTVFVYRHGEEHFFIMGDILNSGLQDE